MKSLVVISLTLLASFFMAACAPAVDTQSVIETGIAATAQISRLETAAAGNGEQSEEPSNQTAQELPIGYEISFNGSHDRYAPANTPLVLVLGWIAKTADAASEFASVVEFDLVLDGEHTTDLQGYWSEVTDYSDFDGDGLSDYQVEWKYPLGELSPGTYQVVGTTRYSHQITDGFDLDDNGSEDTYGSDEVDSYSLFVDVWPDVSGMWINNLGWVYEISQNGPEFSWVVFHQDVTEYGFGNFVGMGSGGPLGGSRTLQVVWGDDQDGSGSATGRLDFDADLYGTRIEWDNGVVFSREDQTSTNSVEGSPMFTVSKDTNCRYGPSSSAFDIRQTIFAGESVPIVGVGKPPAQEWWLVTVKGMDCWVWKETGQSSGDTQGVASVNPPEAPAPVAEEDQNQDDGEDGGEDEEWRPEDHCAYGDITMFVDPSNGKHPTTFTFTITGYHADEQVFFHIWNHATFETLFEKELRTDANGNIPAIKLNTEANDERGQYEAWSSGECTEDASAVFIIE